MLQIGIVGVGKMGLSHLAIANALDGMKVVALCDPNSFMTGAIARYSSIDVFPSLQTMVDSAELDAVIISTPTRLHAEAVRICLSRGIHVFCEKPFTLAEEEGQELADLAEDRRLVGQVGYHYRFVGAFQEVKRLLDAGAIGSVNHASAEAYGPVITRPATGAWRTRKGEGGGALMDYGAHPIDLLNWYFGEPETASGSVMKSVFSREADDEAYSTLQWRSGTTGQLSVNWSDTSERKMSTRLAIWGTNGKIVADRQESRVYLSAGVKALPDYIAGWNVRFTTDLTKPVPYYLRGEEYTAQLERFRDRIVNSEITGLNDFRSALGTDRVIRLIRDDAACIVPAPTRRSVRKMKRGS